jgi:hypothetical protein
VQRIRTDFSQQSRDGSAGGIRIRVLADRADDPLAVDAFPIGPSFRPSKLPNIWTALPLSQLRRGGIVTRLGTKLRTRRAGVNCFAAAMLFEMRRLLFRDLFAYKPDRNAKACHIGTTRIFSQK